jgi:uncharacterized protein (TIGR02145 family)
MKNKNRILIYLFIAIGFLLILTNSCKKDENSPKIDPIITWANPADIEYGTLLSKTQLNARVDELGTLIYTPGIGTKLNEGNNQDLKVDFIPTDETACNSASKTVKINVTASYKIDPIITWANPSDIAYGTLLSRKQLNASADVPGIFVYTPEIGTKLNVGINQDLKIDFTPTDETTYRSASKTVKINVIVTASSGTVTDIDGNIYKTLTYGTQTWMVENLKTTKYNDGDSIIPNITDPFDWANLKTPAYCWYDNNISNKDIYGALYNWYAVNTGKLAPTGWHVSTDDEWTILLDYLIANGYNYDGTITGDRYSNNKIAKALASAIGWPSIDYGDTTFNGAISNTDYPGYCNATGFTALPGGSRDNNGTFANVPYFFFCWSATEFDALYARELEMGCGYDGILGSSYFKEQGLSVRCVRDN